MNHRKTTAILFILMQVACSLALICERGSQCTNGQGYYCAIGNSGACSCASGFSGNDCATIPADTCPYSPVSSDSAQFKPSVKLNVHNSMVDITVTANLEQPVYADPSDAGSALLTNNDAYSLETIIQFGDGSVVDYPNTEATVWTKDIFECQDRFHIRLSWDDAKSKALFTDAKIANTYVQTITITRRYHLPALTEEGEVMIRTETVTKNLEIVFPTEVEVNTQLSISGPVSVTVSAVIAAGYQPSTDVWTIVIDTNTARPYHLSDPTFDSVITESSLIDRLINSISIENVSGCSTNSESCKQRVTIKMESCDALNGDFKINMKPICNVDDPNTCTPLTGNIVALTGSIHTESACGSTQLIDLTATFGSFARDLTTPKTTFFASDIAYFATNIDSQDAVLTAKTLNKVCIELVNGNGRCEDVAWTLVNSGSDNPAFSLFLAETRRLSNSTTAVDFKIRAVILVEWQNVKRAVEVQVANVRSTFTILPDEQQTTQDDDSIVDDDEDSSANRSTSVLAIASLAGFVFAALL